LKKFCDFCITLADPVVHKVYANSDYYFCEKHESWGPLGIIEEFRLDHTIKNQEEAKT